MSIKINKNLSVGEKFGYWQVLETQGVKALCLCTACGQEKEIVKYNLLDGKSKSCGCTKKGKPLELGAVFGKLQVIDNTDIPQQNGLFRVLVQCECGNQKYVYKHSLVSGNTQSCGCTKTKDIKLRVQHPREYNSWNYIKQVCYNENHPFYKMHGGNGIIVHPDWKDDFSQFLIDVGTAPRNTIIDRIDRTSDYTPGNCFWSNRKKYWKELERAEINKFNKSFYTKTSQGKVKISESTIRLIREDHMNGEANINNIASKFNLSPDEVINIIFNT